MARFCAAISSTIGPRSNVQDNAVVHIDTPNETRLGELVTVGHSAIVHACVVDDEVLIGMGAIILDGAEIGARSIIGANTLVTLGTKIPPGSLVLGSPAKVRRALTLDEQKDIARWPWSYVETSKHFREFYSRNCRASVSDAGAQFSHSISAAL
jgi:carbonic anhydrase/acetyltransferase-like protein (isoleucine patch superfamily)